LQELLLQKDLSIPFIFATGMSNRLKSFLLLVLLAVIWGSSFFLIKKSLIAFQPTQVMGLRISITGFLFLPFLRTGLKKIRHKNWLPLLVVGLFGSAIPAFCYAFAQTHISSITTGILNSLTPLFTLLLGVLFFQVKHSIYKLAGVLFGLVGAVLLIINIQTHPLETNIFYASFIVIGTICYAISGNVVKEYLIGLKAFSISVVSYSFIAPIGLATLWFTRVDEVFYTHEQVWISFASVTALAIAGTVLASLLYFYLVQITSALFASLVSYLIPIVAMLFGFFDGENIEIIHILGLLLISAGVYLAQIKHDRYKINDPTTV
jgi:drug/metabolite transporter (DMT)-like permease